MAKTYRAVEMNDKAGRFAIVDRTTGSVLSDAQGYGYKSKTKAYRGYAYQLKQAAVQ